MLLQAPQPDKLVSIGHLLGREIATGCQLVLAFIGGLLAVYTIRLVHRGLRPKRDREIGRIVTLADRK